ncbi:MAG TPA: SDR family NAD(P)-dependent oxidoreductase [Thermoleophilia bacterium]|nr:SDR family NAD(P)-dependent oxidoreductase [Thermoleophilia bacterium]
MTLVQQSTRRWSAGWTGADGPVVAITGASKGIGRTLAVGLAARGARVGLLSRDRARIDEARHEIARSGGEAVAVRTDVTDVESVEAALDVVANTFGRLDAAIANAGITEVGPAESTSAESFRRVVDTNLTGVFITAAAAGRRLLAAGGGSLVLIGSTFASSAIVDWAAYSASKAGVVQLGKVLALEWASRGVRVNVVCPTATLTDQNRELFEDEAFKAAIVSRIPLGRLLETEELVGPVAFLISPDAAMVTGQALYVDGGWTLP